MSDSVSDYWLLYGWTYYTNPLRSLCQPKRKESSTLALLRRLSNVHVTGTGPVSAVIGWPSLINITGMSPEDTKIEPKVKGQTEFPLIFSLELIMFEHFSYIILL